MLVLSVKEQPGNLHFIAGLKSEFLVFRAAIRIIIFCSCISSVIDLEEKLRMKLVHAASRSRIAQAKTRGRRSSQTKPAHWKLNWMTQKSLRPSILCLAGLPWIIWQCESLSHDCRTYKPWMWWGTGHIKRLFRSLNLLRPAEMMQVVSDSPSTTKCFYSTHVDWMRWKTNPEEYFVIPYNLRLSNNRVFPFVREILAFYMQTVLCHCWRENLRSSKD